MKVYASKDYVKEYVQTEIEFPQSDWNQNNPLANDYVKNRTHWENIIVDEKTFIENTRYVLTAYTNTYQYSRYVDEEFVVGNKYNVIYNNVEYNDLTCSESNGFPTVGSMDFSTYPFAVYTEKQSDGRIVLYFAVSKSNSIGQEIFGVSRRTVTTEIKKIDPKYLPDNIGGIQPDWNQNDETAPDFVKNRSHYKESAFAPVIDTTVSYDSYECGFYVYNLTPAVGDRYKVSIDGDVEQEFTLAEDMVYVYVHSSNGKTYTLNFYDGWYSIHIVVSDDSKDDISLYIEEEQYTYHIIPEEYLPVLVGRVYEGSDAGEIFNDGGGNGNVASGVRSHAEGSFTTASGLASHAEGADTIASGVRSHAEGNYTEAVGENSHAEGTKTAASGKNSHAEGHYTEAIGENSHAEGLYTEAICDNSHAEGKYNYLKKYILCEPEENIGSLPTTVKYYYADDFIFSEHTGYFRLPNYDNSTRNFSDLKEGQYFITGIAGKTSINRFISYDGSMVTYETLNRVETTEYDNDYVHVVGNGSEDKARSNAYTLDWDGNAWYAGDVYVGSTSGIIRDEGSKKLATEEFVSSAITEPVARIAALEAKEVSWDDLKNKPTEIVGSATIECPEDTGGLTNVFGFLKVSDFTPTIEDFENGYTITYAYGATETCSVDDITVGDFFGCGVDYIIQGARTAFLVFPKDTTHVSGMTIPKGFYFNNMNGYNHILTFPGREYISMDYLPTEKLGGFTFEMPENTIKPPILLNGGSPQMSWITDFTPSAAEFLNGYTIETEDDTITVECGQFTNLYEKTSDSSLYNKNGLISNDKRIIVLYEDVEGQYVTFYKGLYLEGTCKKLIVPERTIIDRAFLPKATPVSLSETENIGNVYDALNNLLISLRDAGILAK